MNVIVEKIKSFLFFELEDGSKSKYDLKDGSMYKIRNGMEKQLKSLNTFFRGINKYDVLNGFKDEKYKTFMKKIIDEEDRCENIGTFLNRLSKYSHLENYCLLNINCDGQLKLSTSEYPNDILKIFSKYNITIDNDIEDSFVKNKDLFINSLRFVDNCYNNKKYIDRITDLLYKNYYYGYRSGNFENLINQYNYEYKSLIKYLIDYLPDYENVSSHDGYNKLYDYAKMQYDMSKNKKFEKYPKYLRSIHDIVTMNYNTFRREYQEDIFKNRVDYTLEYKNNKYILLMPKCTDDVKQEGVQLRHCVASYISKILDGYCQIGFIRKDPNESLVTIEIKDNKITQARGEMNRNINEEEKKFLKEVCKEKNLELHI